VPGDTNGVFDVFVRDRLLGVTERVSVASDGTQGSSHSGGPFISQDGRYVTFYSAAPNLVAGDTNACAPDFVTGTCRDVFVNDRLTGATRRVSVSSAGADADEKSLASSFSPDGRFVVFQSLASNLVPGDGPTQDVFVRGADTGDAGAEHSGDDRVDDTVLRVADASGMTATLADLCPSSAAAAAGSRVAFLRPEAAGTADAPASCVQTDADLNEDGDQTDLVVQLYDGATVHDLGCAATDLALSPTHLAALISECDQGGAETDGCPAGGSDFSADGDAADRVLAVQDLSAPLPASCAAWAPTALAGSALDVSGDVVALLTQEADLSPLGTPLNGDADALDRVLRLVDADTGGLVPLVDDQMQSVAAQAAEDFVMGPALVAFRTRETAQSNAPPPGCSLNGDGDCDDDVLQVYLLATGTLLNTGQAVVPCPLPECDPRKPYRVSEHTVRFLTLEGDQGEDLNQDGDQTDFLIQVFNVQARQARVVAEVALPPPPDAGDPAPPPAGGSDPLAAPSEEVPSAQTSQVAVAIGRCVEETQDVCDPESAACAAGEFCFADVGEVQGLCVRDTGAACYPDRPAGEQGCFAGASCVRDYVVLAIADRDADQVPDAIDDCPGTANTDQADADQDGVGDACDLQTCGDGVQQLDEACDDGDLDDADGCDSNCRITVCGNGIVTAGEACDDGNALSGDGCSPACIVEECSNGIDDDGDGVADHGNDPGCVGGLADLSERDAVLPCDDGEDDDGDLLADYPADPGCFNLLWAREDPACSNGEDDDGDTFVDHDGGGVGGPDPQCLGAPHRMLESPDPPLPCGLGMELVVVLAGLRMWRRGRSPAVAGRWHARAA
jgi:cysteine-rich repeat protein